MKSAANKGRQHARRNKTEQAGSAVDQSLEQLPKLSCLCCKYQFTSQEEKRNHLIKESSCQLFLKNCYLDRKFVNDTQICYNYYLNENMCPFCMFNVDDGDVVYHVLIATNCREKLEEAVSRYHEPSTEFLTHCEPAPQHELQQETRFQYNTRNIHKRKYATTKRCKDQETVKYNNYSKNSHKCEKDKQNCPYYEHLYCFNCKKFIKSQADVSCHKCKPTRILSRYWYNKAAWTKDQYQCKICSNKFFHDKNPLEKHMLTHEKKRSQLFQFVPSSSIQTARMDSLDNTCLQKNVSVKRDKYRSHASNGHRAVMFLQEHRKQTEVPPVEDEDLTDDICSDMSRYDDNYDVALDTTSEESSVEVGVIEETRPSNISVELSHNTPEPAEINKPSIYFNCENCGRVFCLSDSFIAHIMMFPNCLMFYEKLESEPPALVPFCFKCKRTIRTDTRHQCIGVVAITYKCALCYSMFPNIYNLSEHENEKHTESTLEKMETAETLNENQIFVNSFPVYKGSSHQ